MNKIWLTLICLEYTRYSGPRRVVYGNQILGEERQNRQHEMVDYRYDKTPARRFWIQHRRTIDHRPSSFHTVNSNSLQLNFTFHGYIVMTNVKAIRSSARCNVIIPACVTRSDEKRSIRAGATSCSQKR